MALFEPGVCYKCSKNMMIRADSIPFCIDCENKAKAQFARMRPDLAKGLDLKSEHVTRESQDAVEVDIDPVQALMNPVFED